jgi:hypothetical protein
VHDCAALADAAVRPLSQLELIDGTAQSVEEQLVTSNAEIAIYYRPDRASDVAKPLVNPESWREVSLTTVKERPYSRVVGALVPEAMRSALATSLSR